LKTFAVGYVNVEENEIELLSGYDMEGVGEVVGFPRGYRREYIAYNEKGCQPYDGMVFNE